MNEQKKFSFTAPERETIILFSDEDNSCEVYTCSRPIMTKLDKLCRSNPESYKLVNKDSYSKTYQTDKRLISFRTPKTVTMTNEQRAAASTRMKNMRKSSLDKTT